MLLKNENASLKLEFVNYEFPEAGRGTDAYDQSGCSPALPYRASIPLIDESVFR